ncbi:Putative major facilitator, sugar transporter, major facilitator superfamily [Septoria linicola]|uniref:Major facilitator, sugar transporter, major facilitator superfamily n=1 Tax=Septoria linicola TaxID=215465 RepID=A0A9Q9ANK5_9PEZI|nr:putative major facilitator, sugar transporter, major facilitator superfamily [Septoria linicola]USW50258.1 Putative major facilitator, sugar transporter, major facilitator superfamily [Septoria linicola]
MVAGSGAAVGAAAIRRQQLTGKKGVASLMQNKRAFFIAVFASFGGLLYGYQQGVLGQALVMPAFIDDFPTIHNSSGATGWLTSILQLGGWGGALTSGILCEVFSRKHTLFWGAMWMVLGSYLAAGAVVNQPAYLFAGRFFTGIGVGTLSAIGPLYNAELAPPEVRGFLVALQQLTTTIGIFLAYWIAYGTSHIDSGNSQWAWRIPLLVQGIPAIILAVGVWFLPFSPRLLMNKGKEEEALRTLANLRGLPEHHELVQVEILEIKAEVLFERKDFAKKFPNVKTDSIFRREIAQYVTIFRNKDSFKRVALGSLVMFFQQWSGIDSIIYYAPIIFQNLGLTSTSTSLLATGITGVINVAVTIPAIMVLDRFGRKTLGISSSIGMFFCQLSVGIIVATCGHDWPGHVAAGWVAVVFVWLYIVNFAYGWGPVSWTLIAEIFPLSIRAKGTSISASSNWMNNFVIAFITPPMLEGIDWGTYIFFSFWCLAGAAFLWFFIPETTGKTLEEMDAAFGSHSNQEDMDELCRIQQEIGLVDLLTGDSRATISEKDQATHVETKMA